MNPDPFNILILIRHVLYIYESESEFFTFYYLKILTEISQIRDLDSDYWFFIDRSGLRIHSTFINHGTFEVPVKKHSLMLKIHYLFLIRVLLSYLQHFSCCQNFYYLNECKCITMKYSYKHRNIFLQWGLQQSWAYLVFLWTRQTSLVLQ